MKILIMFLICTNIVAQPVEVEVPDPAATARAEEAIARAEVAQLKLLAILARNKEINDRLNLLKHKRSSMRLVLNLPNPEAWLSKNIEAMDFAQMENFLSQFEAQDIIQKGLSTAQKASDDKVKAAKLRMKDVDCTELIGVTLQDMCILLQQ